MVRAAGGYGVAAGDGLSLPASEAARKPVGSCSYSAAVNGCMAIDPSSGAV